MTSRGLRSLGRIAPLLKARSTPQGFVGCVAASSRQEAVDAPSVGLLFKLAERLNLGLWGRKMPAVLRGFHTGRFFFTLASKILTSGRQI